MRSGLLKSKILSLAFGLGGLLLCADAQAGLTNYLLQKCREGYARLGLQRSIAAGNTIDTQLELEATKFRTGALGIASHPERAQDSSLAAAFRAAKPDLAAQVDRAAEGIASPEVVNFVLARSDDLQLLTGQQLREYLKLVSYLPHWEAIRVTQGRIKFMREATTGMANYMPIRPRIFVKDHRDIEVGVSNSVFGELVAHELAHRIDEQVIRTRLPALQKKVSEIYERRFAQENIFYAGRDDFYYAKGGKYVNEYSQKSILHLYFNEAEYWAYSVGAYFNGSTPVHIKKAILQNGSYPNAYRYNDSLLQESRDAALAHFRAQVQIGKERAGHRFRSGLVVKPPSDEEVIAMEKEMLAIYDRAFRDRDVLRARDPEMFNLVRSVYGEFP